VTWLTVPRPFAALKRFAGDVEASCNRSCRGATAELILMSQREAEFFARVAAGTGSDRRTLKSDAVIINELRVGLRWFGE